MQRTCACSGSEGPYKVGYLNFVTIFVVLRPNPICDLFTRMFTGVKGMSEGFCFNSGDFYFQFQLTVLFLTGQSVTAFSSCEPMEL